MIDSESHILHTVSAAYRSNRINRRQALRILGAFGVAAAALPAMKGITIAQEDDHAAHKATPVLGPREDGTNLWKVQVGGHEMEAGLDFHAFFPGEITINADDAVYFAFAPMGVPGFHTVSYTSGEAVPPILVPDIVDGTPVASPEGPPRLIINPQLAWTDGREAYDGTGFTNSGLDVFRLEEGPYILTFSTPGSFDYECAVHGIVMKGKVTVQEAGADLPFDQAAYEAMAAEQIAMLVEEGMATIAEASEMAATPAAEGATTWDVAVGPGGLSQARVMRFIPDALTVKVGDTVRWTNLATGEPHTVTFLGGEEQPEDAFVEPQDSGPPKFIQNTMTFQPVGGAEFDGVGYSNSGFMGFPPELNDLFGLVGETWELTFTEAGEYPYYCILHAGGPEAEGGMTGAITVEA